MEGCACQYSVCQLLTAISEISAHMLEIADLGVDPTTTCDSHDQDRTGATCWVIMCTQLSQHMTDATSPSVSNLVSDLTPIHYPKLHRPQ